MAEITLSEYTGYIFLEMIKAREMADAYSKSVASRYEQDPVLKHFPTPRFKVPKITLTIPMLVASARFTKVEKFDMPLPEFEKIVLAHIDNTLSRLSHRSTHSKGASPRRSRKRAPSENLLHLVKAFHARVVDASAAPLDDLWAKIFDTALLENQLADAYKQEFPGNEPFQSTLAGLRKVVKERTTIDHAQIQSLLIDPETNAVKNGSSETTVFTVQAEMTEDGFFLKTVRDSEGGAETKIVDFD